ANRFLRLTFCVSPDYGRTKELCVTRSESGGQTSGYQRFAGGQARGQSRSAVEATFHIAGEPVTGVFTAEMELPSSGMQGRAQGGDLTRCGKAVAGQGIAFARPVHESRTDELIAELRVELFELGRVTRFASLAA